jgi:hypothetical protein
MFPLQDEDGEPAEPVRGPEDDPYAAPDYAGYASCVTCGKHDSGGRPWRQALEREIAYLESAPQLPLLGSPGHSAAELLSQGRDAEIAGQKKPR